ncbi:hypothetical protein [Streptomyces mirabilis]
MTAAIDLAALPPSVVVPGIAAWLGWVAPEPVEPVESYEDYLQRISQEA